MHVACFFPKLPGLLFGMLRALQFLVDLSAELSILQDVSESVIWKQITPSEHLYIYCFLGELQHQ